jgi:hypothetical protein
LFCKHREQWEQENKRDLGLSLQGEDHTEREKYWLSGDMEGGEGSWTNATTILKAFGVVQAASPYRETSQYMPLQHAIQNSVVYAGTYTV